MPPRTLGRFVKVHSPLLAEPQTARERLIFALDVDHLDEAERYVKMLHDRVGVFKVGPRLFTRAGSLVFDLIHGLGSQVFLDLKFHDIPASVGAAAREVARHRVKMFTVHSLGGSAMLREVAAQLSRVTLVPGLPPPMPLAVTILTSHGPEDVRELGFQQPVLELVQHLARMAVDAGAAGLVCSGHEVGPLRQILPEQTVLVVPGIRSPEDTMGDQTRVMTPAAAIADGASYIVVGRPIRDARDPIAAAERMVEGIEAGLQSRGSTGS